MLEKYWETSKEVHILFVDYQNDYDSIDRSLGHTEGIYEKLIRLAQMTMEGSHACVCLQGERTAPFKIGSGLRQGDSLSPLLFNFALEKAVRLVMQVEGGAVVGQRLKCLAFADDIALLAEKETDLVVLAKTLTEAASQIGLQINTDKTKYMIMSREVQLSEAIDIGETRYERVDSFKYLGSLVTSINDMYTEIDQRILNANRAYFSLARVFKSKLLSLRLKSRLYKVMVRPVLLYGCESWATTSALENKLQVCENQMLRWITGPIFDSVRGFWKKRPNEELRRLCQISTVPNEIKGRRLQWAGHVVRCGEGTPTRTVMEAKATGKRPRGRPRLRWLDVVKRDCLEQRIVLWKTAAQDRKKWRQVVEAAKDLNGL